MSRAPHGIRIEKVDFSRPQHGAMLLDLLDHYAQDPMGGGEPLSQEVKTYLLQRLAQRPAYAGFLALSAGEAVGLINCFEGFSTFKAQPLLNVHDVIVREGHRGQHIGQYLLRAAEEEARQRGCCKLTLEVLSENTGARTAYERAGYALFTADDSGGAGHALFMQKWI